MFIPNLCAGAEGVWAVKENRLIIQQFNCFKKETEEYRNVRRF